ncbi:hypothetical protein ABW20_dc0101582 [Dactylellina cionopaga]|nr:hypothetical protein ABW20_dc0101582 [Dactylellina cionopaga]
MTDIEAQVQTGEGTHASTTRSEGITIPRRKLEELVKALAYAVQTLQSTVENKGDLRPSERQNAIEHPGGSKKEQEDVARITVASSEEIAIRKNGRLAAFES